MTVFHFRDFWLNFRGDDQNFMPKSIYFLASTGTFLFMKANFHDNFSFQIFSRYFEPVILKKSKSGFGLFSLVKIHFCSHFAAWGMISSNFSGFERNMSYFHQKKFHGRLDCHAHLVNSQKSNFFWDEGFKTSWTFLRRWLLASKRNFLFMKANFHDNFSFQIFSTFLQSWSKFHIFSF